MKVLAVILDQEFEVHLNNIFEGFDSLSLGRALTYLTHQLMILIDRFVFSAKGAGCDSPAQRAGCAGHLVSSAESAKCVAARRKLCHGESGAKRIPRLQRSQRLTGILTRAVGPGYYIPRLRRFAQTEPVQGRT